MWPRAPPEAEEVVRRELKGMVMLPLALLGAMVACMVVEMVRPVRQLVVVRARTREVVVVAH